MIELLTAIALLCQVAPSMDLHNIRDINKHQLKCQQEYIKCVNEKESQNIIKGIYATNLSECILERRVK